MNPKFRFRGLSILFLYFGFFSALAQDTVVIQTLTFDSIFARRSVWRFPDNPEQYRKILMLYALKCDPQTPWDKYDCGEWDYLTYSVVYQKTGKFDSAKKSHPFFKIGNDSPDSVMLTSKPTTTTKQSYLYSNIIDKVNSENEFLIGKEQQDININSKKFRIQFTLTSAELKANGFTRGNIHKIKLNYKGSAQNLENFKIKMKNGTISEYLTSLDFEVFFHNRINLTGQGWFEFVLLRPFNWNGISPLSFEISYEAPVQAEIITEASTGSNCIYSEFDDRYLLCDGKNDWAEAAVPGISGTQKFSWEGWFKVNSWKAWSNFLIFSDKVALQAGNNKGQVYCIVRNPDNTHGNALGVVNLNEWAHLAMVFDGTKPTNNEKLKLFVNGSPVSLTFTGNIPSWTPQLSDLVYINRTIDGGTDEIRIWNTALPDSIFSKWMFKELDNSHPFYNYLSAYYSMNDDTSTVLTDKSPNKINGRLIGCSEWKNYPADEIYKYVQISTLVPNLKFVRGDYSSHIDSVLSVEKTIDPPISISKFRIENYRPVQYEVTYSWKAGYEYTYNSAGKAIDSNFVPTEQVLKNSVLNYYEKPYEILDQFEIGRFITPYGIGLDLGPDGFRWLYDVTDYAPLLKGDVDFSAGNLQELIDVKFLFIKGTPPRQVKNINRIWGPFRSFSYRELSDNTALSPKTVKLTTGATQFKIKTRLTGHGHNSNTGEYPHCCEWKNNTHYFFVNTQKAAEWHIFQYDDCALNPVFPQGGTWPGSREGWCPGDVVKDYEFELAKYITADSATFDYDITKVPTDNLGMGSGNYVVAMDLIEYSKAAFDTDAEIYDVIAPSNWDYYSRRNPICSPPVVVVRNNGTSRITSITFTFGVSGGKNEVYNWQGQIEPNEKSSISLPVSGNKFWLGDGKNIFTVTVSNPNNIQDQNPENDKFITTYNMPDLYKNKIVLYYKTNNRPQDFTYTIKDLGGKTVFSKYYNSNLTLYRDTLNLPDGCYTLRLTDANNLGLSYWAYPAQGQGSFDIYDIDGKLVKHFNPDFGKGITYSFNLGDVQLVQEPNFEGMIEVFPNPAKDNINIRINYTLGLSNIKLYDPSGRLILSENTEINGSFNKSISLSGYSPGVFVFQILSSDYNLKKMFIKD